MTTANKITIGRIVLVPFFAVQLLYYAKTGADLHRWLAVAAFLLAAASDWLDGYLARHCGQHTELGAVLDPLADKLLSMSALVLLSIGFTWDLARLPLWLVGTVIGRDVILILGWLVVHHFHPGIEVRPRFIGKTGTVLLMACVVCVLLRGPALLTWNLALAVAICDGVSGLLYLCDGLRQMHGHPAVSPVEQKAAERLIMSKEPTLALQEGDLAPDFIAPISGGTLSLASLRGKNVVLYFYPRDDTPGCTKEACAFRDEFAAFQKRGAVVLGVSPDGLKAHEKFVEKYRLPFPLLADEEKKIGTAYGAWGQKSFLGRKYMGMHRVTFLIGPDGCIRKIWAKVKPATHAAEVLAAL